MIDSAKSELRRSARKDRDAISERDRSVAANAIARFADQIVELCHGRQPVVSSEGRQPVVSSEERQPVVSSKERQPVVTSYFAIGSELDPVHLDRALRKRGVTVAFPVMVAKAAPLSFRAWSEGDPLVTREWGIREPDIACPVVTPDILLVPLLAVDGSGNRLGYGGGFYDRTLSSLRQARRCLGVGVAYSTQRVDWVPHAAYDEPLPYLLTPNGIEALQ